MAHLDVDGGVVDLPAVTGALTRALAERGRAHARGRRDERDRARRRRLIRVTTDAGELRHALARGDRRARHERRPRRAARLRACASRSRRTARARPSTSSRRADTRAQFTADVMPVIAYLDAGIYCHPIVEGLVDAVKIGYYNPPDLPGERASIDGIADFVEQCMPGLRTRDGQRRRGRRPVRLRPRRRRRVRARRRSRASPTPSSASDGEAPATSSRRGSGGCSPSCALQGGTVYDIAPLRSRPFRTGSRPMTRPSQTTLQQRLAEGVVLGAEGYVFELERRGYIQAGPVRPRGDPRRARRAAPAAPRVPARRVGRHGRADLLRPPRQAARRRARAASSRR